MGAVPTFVSPWHYDSHLDGPGIHFDIAFIPGVGVTHTLAAVNPLVVTRDVGSPYTRINIRHPNGTEIVKQVPVGVTVFPAVALTGFTVVEDCANFTASP